ncbi:MAG: hypothetical protein BWK73_49785 [Thiothrix lacustris]|uniref:Uncharacterized protein n=1 Tax=Thiothrix lacustris TaxID=525917 RepID=A0A1Y1Q903_9GAMM|nr:MAG: hypothetical protein BWK73_49785 [Thiothrix lacustris]
MSDDVVFPVCYTDPNLRRVAVQYLQQQVAGDSDEDALEWLRSMPADSVVPSVMLQAVCVPIRGRDVLFLCASACGYDAPMRCVIELEGSDLDGDTVNHFKSGGVVTFKAVWRGADWDYTVEGVLPLP